MVTRKKVNTPPKPQANPVAAKAPRSRRRSVAAGDVPPVLTPPAIEGFTVHSSVDAAQESKMGAMQDVVAGMPVDLAERHMVACFGDMELLPHLWSTATCGGVDVEVVWGEARPFDETTDRKALTASLEQAVRGGLLARLRP